MVMRDKITGKDRGFGFITFLDGSVVGRAIGRRHDINGRSIEAKSCVPRSEQDTQSRSQGQGTDHKGDQDIRKVPLRPTSLALSSFGLWLWQLDVTSCASNCVATRVHSRCKPFSARTAWARCSLLRACREGRWFALAGTTLHYTPRRARRPLARRTSHAGPAPMADLCRRDLPGRWRGRAPRLFLRVRCQPPTARSLRRPPCSSLCAEKPLGHARKLLSHRIKSLTARCVAGTGW